MANQIIVKSVPCLVSLLGETQTFKTGDKVEIFNILTRKVSRVGTIVSQASDIAYLPDRVFTLVDDNGNKFENYLQSARLLK